MRILRNNNNFYLNVTEWFAIPGGTKVSKLIKEISKEELNVFLKSFCMSARNKDGTLSAYKHLSMQSIREPPLIVSSLAAAQQTVFHYLTSLLLRQIKHYSICKRPHKNRQHCRPNRANKKLSETDFQWNEVETVRQRWARTGREQGLRKTTKDDLVLPQSPFWPTRTRDSTSTNANNSVLAKNPSRTWVFWRAQPKRRLESLPATKNH